jgi:hypothetical protein
MDREVNNGQETLDKDEQAVSRLVAGLKHVEAPANFERRVMAKIAEGRPQRRSLFGLPAIAYAVPALLVVLIAAFFVFKLRQSTPVRPESVTTAETVRQPEATPSANSTQMPEPPSVAQDQQQPTLVSTPGTIRKAVQQNRIANTNRGGGSYDEALPNKKQPLPEGIDPNSRSSANRGEVMSSTPIAVRDVLSMIGIEAESIDGWKVKTVSANSVADRAGIKAGDVILSLGDHDLSAATDFQNSGSINSIRYSRNGVIKTVKIR